MAFERGWASIPPELKLPTLSYALQSNGPVDCKIAEDIIKQSYPLFSEKFSDSAIAIEAFCTSNTFQLRGTVIDGKPSFMLPPPHYRKYIRRLELLVFPNVELWTHITGIDFKALFPVIDSLKITVDCNVSNTSIIPFLRSQVTELPSFNLQSLEIRYIPLPPFILPHGYRLENAANKTIRLKTMKLLTLSGGTLHTDSESETVSGGVFVQRSWRVKNKILPKSPAHTRFLAGKE